MVHIAVNTLHYEPKDTFKTAFYKLTKKLGLNKKAKKIDKELSLVEAKEKENLNKNNFIYYTHNSQYDEDLQFLDDIMQVAAVSEEARKVFNEFYKHGGKFVLTNNIASSALYNTKNNVVLINPLNTNGEITQKRKDAITSTAVHECTHALQLYNSAKYKEELEMQDADMVTSLMDSRIKEGAANASQFIASVEIATDKDRPRPEVLDRFRAIYPEMYLAGMKALGADTSDKEFAHTDVSKIDLSKLDLSKKEDARLAVFKDWDQSEDLIYRYGYFLGEQSWNCQVYKSGDMDKRGNISKMLDVGFFNPDTKEPLYKEPIDNLITEGFIDMGKACVTAVQDKIEWFNERSGKEDCKTGPNNFEDYKKDFASFEKKKTFNNEKPKQSMLSFLKASKKSR